MQEKNLRPLAQRYLDNDLSPNELQDFFEMLHDPHYAAVFENFIDETWQEMNKRPAEKIRPRKNIARRILIAAAILIFISGSWFLAHEILNKKDDHALIAHDVIAPSRTKAIIILSKGRKLLLDSMKTGLVAVEGNTSVIKLNDGQVSYAAEGDEVLYNTLQNPKGSEVAALTLSDGTKVWLNTASSLVYPTVFKDGERKVQLSGEAYFEISPDASRPFIVSSSEKGFDVEAFGTTFYVNAYSDQESSIVTLLKGSVKVSNEVNNHMLLPGQQAVLNKGNIKVNETNDLESVSAWKAGVFSFNDADIRTVMSQISKWYDVNVTFKGEVKETFFATINRHMNLSSVLKVLEATGGAHFEISEREVIVKP